MNAPRVKWSFDLAERCIGLRDEARKAGDRMRASLCERALNGQESARREVLTAFVVVDLARRLVRQ